MAEIVLTDAKVYAGAYDLSGDHNKVAVAFSYEDKDVTRFGAQGKGRRAGLGSAQVNGEGVVNAGTDLQDDVHFSDLGVYQRIMTLAAIGDLGDKAMAMRGVELEYTPMDAAVGDVHGFSFDAASSGLFLPSATVLHDRETAETATGSETAQQVGAITAPELGYAALHVVAASGTSLDVRVQSDTAVGFPSPTTQFSFAQATGITSEWSTAIAATTDDWWRVDWTIVGGSWTFIVVFGIK
jgi:hypothetical protein